MNQLPKYVVVEFNSQKLSSKHLNFYIKLPNGTYDSKIFKKLHKKNL